MAEVGSAFVSVMPSAKGFGTKLNSQVSGDLKSSGSKAGKLFGTALKVGALGVLAGAAAVGSFLKGSIEEAREAQKVGALTESTIKATGGAAKVTAKQVGDLAEQISLKTGIDDETIQSGENMLLTFKNIRNEVGKGNDIFDQSTESLVDLSSAMGTEPKQAAIQLGKALNDPIKGVSALSRVGVTFTDGQKKVIEGLVETGDTAGAQKVILHELNSEFGGAAEAQADAGDKMKVAWGNLQESAGDAILPIVNSILPKLTDAINWLANTGVPAVQGFWDNLAPAREVIGKVAAGVGDAVGAIRDGNWGEAWHKAKAVGDSAMEAIGRGVRRFGRERLVPAIKSAMEGARQRWAKSWAGFGDDPEKSYDETLASTRAFGTRLRDRTVSTGYAVVAGFARAMRGFPKVAASIAVTLTQATQGLPGLARHIAVDIAGNFAHGIDSLPTVTGTIIGRVIDALRSGGSAAVSAARSIGVNIIMSMVEGVQSAAGNLASAAAGAVGGAIDAARNKLGINSPSRVFVEIGHQTTEGLALGIDGGHARVSSSMDRLAAGMVLNRPSLAGATGAAGGSSRAVFHLYDRDDVLLGSMEGVADGRIHGAAQLAGETARAM